MGFFDFLSAPAQDPTLEDQALWKKKKTSPEAKPFQDDEALRLAQHTNEEARAAAPKGLPGEMAEYDRGQMANAGHGEGLRKAVESANVVLSTLPGTMASSSSSPFREVLSDKTRLQVKAVGNALSSGKLKVHPSVLADDFERLSGNQEFQPHERKAMAGVASMFRQAASAIEQQKALGSSKPFNPSPQAVEEAQDKLELLRRQEAAARQKLETVGLTNPQRPNIENSIIEIAKEREGLVAAVKKFQSNPPLNGQPQGDPAKPPLEADIKKNLAGGGRTEESFRLAVVGALKQAEKGAGFDIEDLNAEVPFSNAFRTLLPVLDPSQKVTRELVDLALKQKAPQQEPKSEGSASSPSPESDATLAELKMKQKERRDLFASLGKDPSSQNWLSAIVTILLSAAIGSEKALRVMGYASKTNTLKYQLDILNQEINEDIAILRDQRSGEREMKKEAARRLQRKEDDSSTWKRQMGMAMLNHKLIIERNQKRNNPETDYMKKLSAAFQRATGMAAKFSSTMNDPFADEGVKAAAQKSFEMYMKKAAEIDAQLTDMSNGVLEEEAVEE